MIVYSYGKFLPGLVLRAANNVFQEGRTRAVGPLVRDLEWFSTNRTMLIHLLS